MDNNRSLSSDELIVKPDATSAELDELMKTGNDEIKLGKLAQDMDRNVQISTAGTICISDQDFEWLNGVTAKECASREFNGQYKYNLCEQDLVLLISSLAQE